MPDGLIASVLDKIAEVGPNVSLIARALGVPRRDVHAIYQLFLDNNFAFHAVPHFGALGMRRLVLVASVAPGIQDVVTPVMASLERRCYLTSYSRVANSRQYIFSFNFPADSQEAFGTFVAEVKKRGLLEDPMLFEFNWFRWLPLKVSHYDFERSAWVFDWNVPGEQSPSPTQFTHEKSHADVHVDPLDLAILDELRADATRPLADIYHDFTTNGNVLPYFGKVRKVGDYSVIKHSYNAFHYHYDKHLIKGGLIDYYRTDWLAAGGETRYSPVSILADNITESERRLLISASHSVPYAWLDAGGPGRYYANFCVPSKELANSLSFFSNMTSGMGDKVKMYVHDVTSAGGFGLPVALYRLDGGWQYNPTTAMKDLDAAIYRAKTGLKALD